MKPLIFTIPIRTVPGMNTREHPMARHRRVQKERAVVGCAFRDALSKSGRIKPAYEVRLVRLSAGELDDDNLRGALKSVRDAVASRLKVDDATPLIVWLYDQERCAAGSQAVRIEIRPVSSEREAA